MADKLTLEERIQQMEQRKRIPEEAGFESCTFYPFADMFFEIYPGDHPWIEQSFAVQPNMRQGDPTITELNNPYRDETAVIAFGRACMRFVLTEDAIDEHIDHLLEIKRLLQDATIDDVPIRIDNKKPIYFDHVKRFTEKQDTDELRGNVGRRLDELNTEDRNVRRS